MSRGKAPKAPSGEAAVEITTENLRRHEHESGRYWWSAELVGENIRAGVDNSMGSWTIFDHSEGEPLAAEPGEKDIPRRELLPRWAAQLQWEIQKGEDGEDPGNVRRR